MPRRVDRLEREFTCFEFVAVRKNAIRVKTRILMLPFRRLHAEQLRAGLLGKQAGARRMVWMRVRH